MLTIDEETKLHREVHLKAELEPASISHDLHQQMQLFNGILFF